MGLLYPCHVTVYVIFLAYAYDLCHSANAVSYPCLVSDYLRLGDWCQSQSKRLRDMSHGMGLQLSDFSWVTVAAIGHYNIV